MADTNLQAESVHANSTDDRDRQFHQAYTDWRRAKAAFELAVNPPVYGDDPDELSDPLCVAHGAALDRYLMTPAPCWNAFVWKLRAFRDEDIIDLWVTGPQIVDSLLRDAERLVDEEKKASRQAEQRERSRSFEIVSHGEDDHG